MGSMRVARFAGSQQANSDTTINATEMPAKVVTSVAPTPDNRFDIRRAKAAEHRGGSQGRQEGGTYMLAQTPDVKDRQMRIQFVEGLKARRNHEGFLTRSPDH